MIYLNKILPVFVLPTGIALILLVVGLALRRRALCWAGVAVLWVASTPLVADALVRAAEGWQVRTAASLAPQVQAIVVLSAGRVEPPGDSGVSEWADPDRFFGGVELYKAGKAKLLVFTGGWAPWRPAAKPEGDVLMGLAVDLGVPRDHIATTERVSTTEEEGRAVASLLAARGVKAPPRVLLVTSAFHMRRAHMLFVRAGIDTVPFPVDFKVSAGKRFEIRDLLPNGGSLAKSEFALRELYGVAYYSLTGA